MTTPAPPLAIYDRELVRSLAKAYRDAYVGCQDGKPHAAGMAAARTAFVQRFPFPNEDMAAGVIKAILRAAELKKPGWLSNYGPKRYPSSNEDARAEAEDIGRQWV